MEKAYFHLFHEASFSCPRFRVHGNPLTMMSGYPILLLAIARFYSLSRLLARGTKRCERNVEWTNYTD
jgi:hypothetical protein